MAVKKPRSYRVLKGVTVLLLVLVILSGALCTLLRVTPDLPWENNSLLAFWGSDLGLVCCGLIPLGVLVLLWVAVMIWRSHLNALSRRPLPGYFQEEGGEPVLMNVDPFEPDSFEQDPSPMEAPKPEPAAPLKTPSPFHYETVSADQQPTMVIPNLSARSAAKEAIRRDPLSDTQEFDVKELREKLLTDKLLRDVDQADYVKIPDSPQSDETALMSFGKDSVNFNFRHLDFSKLEVYPNEIGQGFTVLTPEYQAVIRLDITKREPKDQ